MKSSSVNDLKNSHELYTKVKNATRKELLKFIYSKPRNYTELMEFSNLKPGSLYHHLGILDPLIVKIDHGLYKISELGINCVESLQLVTDEETKPKILKNVDEALEQTDLDQEVGNVHGTNLELIWLSPVTYVSIIITLALMFYLGNRGVAFAGSAIYAVGGFSTFLLDFIALMLGIAIMYLIEELVFQYSIYDRLKFISFIRLISMLPAVIVGIALLLLFSGGVLPSANAYAMIFVITLVLGTLVAASGIFFLRGLSKEDAILYATVPGIVDLVLGLVILISL